MRLTIAVLCLLPLLAACGTAPTEDAPVEEAQVAARPDFGPNPYPGRQVGREGPDPAEMEDAPDLGYRPVPHGLQIPADLEMGAPSGVVSTDTNHLIVFNRGRDPLAKFDADGTFIRSWGQGMYVRAHGVRLDSEGNVWATDVGGHTVRKWGPDGEALMTLGVHEQAGEWEVGADSGMLMEPTDLAFGLNGEIYLIIGHGKGPPAVLKFDSGGTMLTSWGRAGTGPSEFDTLHSIVVDAQGLVYVADRQNRRIQIFEPDGTYVTERPYKGLPCGLYVADDQQMYMVSGHAGERLRLDTNGKVLGATGQPGTGLGEAPRRSAATFRYRPDAPLVSASTKRAPRREFPIE